MHRALIAVVSLVMVIAGPAMAQSSQSGLIVKQSPRSVDATVERFTGILERKGITVFAVIDHAAGAEGIGASLAATKLVIFGNPKIGTPLMQSNRMIGIDLPLKALIWEGADNATYLAYNEPTYLAARHGVANRVEVFETMRKALNGLTDAAVAP